MSLRYEEFARLQRGLRGGVSAVAFSSDGTYIATAGMEDRRVYVWRVEDCKLLHTYAGNNCPFLSLEWMPDRSDTIICGSSDGYISVLRFGSEISEVAGFWAHKYPVERLAAKGNQLVSGAHCEACVWTQLSYGCWKLLRTLEGPSTGSKNADEELIIMGIHWTKTKVYRSVVVLTYMHHGIIIYNPSDWTCLQVIPFSDIGGSSMSPEGSRIALSVMGAGFDLYDLDTGVCLATFNQHEPDDGERIVPVLLVHGGRALLGGGTVGRATLWNVHNKRIHQTFEPEPFNTILAIAANYNYDHDRFLIAAGANDFGGNSAVVIWTARSESPRRLRWKWRFFCCFLFPVLVCSFAIVAMSVVLDVLPTLHEI